MSRIRIFFFLLANTANVNAAQLQIHIKDVYDLANEKTVFEKYLDPDLAQKEMFYIEEWGSSFSNDGFHIELTVETRPLESAFGSNLEQEYLVRMQKVLYQQKTIIHETNKSFVLRLGERKEIRDVKWGVEGLILRQANYFSIN